MIKKVWVTRDKIVGEVNDSCIFTRKPVLQNGRYETGGLNCLVSERPARSFKRWYGFTPKRGTCEEYNLELTKC